MPSLNVNILNKIFDNFKIENNILVVDFINKL